jgi:hypothetical protein
VLNIKKEIKMRNIKIFVLMIIVCLTGMTFAQDTTLTVTNDGNVGIGITNPTHKLVVDGNLRVTTANRLMLGGPFSAEYIYNPNGSTMRFHVGNSDRLFIGNAGNVGIGTNGPFSRFHVHTEDLTRADFSTASETSPVFLRFFYNSNIQGGAVGFDTDANTLKLIHGGNFDSSTKGMVISSDGNVGINEAAPGEKLQVKGTVYSSSGGFKFPDGTVQTTAAAGSRNSNYTQFGSLNVNPVTVTTQFTKLITTASTHSFRKNHADSKIEVFVNTRFKLGTYNQSTGIRFKVIIDERTEADFGNHGSMEFPTTREFMSILAVFEGLKVGVHTVSLWGRANFGTVSAVIVDPGNVGGQIIIKETW